MPSMNLEPDLSSRRPLPNAPVFGWASLRTASANTLPAFDDLPHRALTSSGRAALYWALKRLQLAAGAGVLVPAYHCPTMVAPILLAGLRPIYYEITEHGLPLLSSLDQAGDAPAAMIC